VIIPDSVTIIGPGAFNQNQLTTVLIPKSVFRIGSEAFANNILTSVSIGDDIDSIGQRAFANNRLTNVIIPDSVTSIGEEAFANNQLTNVTIGKSVRRIDENAFVNNQLSSLKIPENFRDYVRRLNINNLQITFFTTIFSVLENIPILDRLANTIEINYIYEQGNKQIFNNIIYNINLFQTIYNNKNNLFGYKPRFKFTRLVMDISNNNSIQKIEDSAIDSGGLTNTIFTELSEIFTNPDFPFFERDKYFDIHTIKSSLDNQQVFFIGQLFGYIIKIRQHINIRLDPILLYQILHDDIDLIISEELISIITDFDSNFLNYYPYACYNKEYLKQTKDILLGSGMRGPGNCHYNLEYGIIEDITKIPEETTNKIKDTIASTREKNSQFVNGFREQIDVNTTKLNKLSIKEFYELLAGKDIKLTYDNLIRYLVLVNFNNDQAISIKEIIKNHIDNNDEGVWIKAFLFAVTGLKRIPILGYLPTKQLRIQLENISNAHRILTCYNMLQIKTSVFNEHYTSRDKLNTALYNFFSLASLEHQQGFNYN
jgi:hypothetical protein